MASTPKPSELSRPPVALSACLSAVSTHTDSTRSLAAHTVSATILYSHTHTHTHTRPRPQSLSSHHGPIRSQHAVEYRRVTSHGRDDHGTMTSGVRSYSHAPKPTRAFPTHSLRPLASSSPLVARSQSARSLPVSRRGQCAAFGLASTLNTMLNSQHTQAFSLTLLCATRERLPSRSSKVRWLVSATSGRYSSRV